MPLRGRELLLPQPSQEWTHRPPGAELQIAAAWEDGRPLSPAEALQRKALAEEQIRPLSQEEAP